MDEPRSALVEQRRRHLATTGVVDADEEHLGNVLGDQAIGLPERVQPLAREPVHEHRDEVAEAGRRKRLERLADVAVDRFTREDAAKLVHESLDAAFKVAANNRIQLGAHRVESFHSRFPVVGQQVATVW